MTLSERLIAEICSKMRISGSLETGLATCGVSEHQYQLWLEAGGPLAARLEAEIASAEGELKMVREHQLTGYFEKDWRALAWWLERKYPREYGPKARDKEKGKEASDADALDELLDLLP